MATNTELLAKNKRTTVQTESRVSDVRYSDFNTSFAVHPIKKDLSIQTDVAAIKQSVKNLLLTNKGERLFDPSIGSKIKSILFENFSPQTISACKSYVTQTILNYEPRAQLLDVTVTPWPDKNLLVVRIVFGVINIEDPVTLDVVLEKIR
tara:strand:+ start:843 stop:1292 length:450 start_codon:yes stop_codon:yes gene_type:complete